MGGTVKLIVLDRDGSLGQIPEDFVRTPDDWAPQPGALEAVARLNQAGWRVVVASNQSGLGRGLFDMATLNAVHARMHKLLAGAGARVDAVFVCPHAPEDGCNCRKPEPGLLQQIGQRYGVALADIRAVGDSLNDVPLLEVVERPVAVDPDPKLRAQAQRRGWEIISLRD